MTPRSPASAPTRTSSDASGNIRVGNDKANIETSTGVDIPLDKDGNPTERGKRLSKLHQQYGTDDLLEDDMVFTKDDQGCPLSSSKQVQ